MKQTFVVDISYDSQYKILSDYVGKPQCECNMEILLRKDQRANIGDIVFFRCLHYWYKGIAAKGLVEEVVDQNCVDVRFTILINPEEHPFLSFSELEEVLPNKNWKDRYSDIRLDADEAQILNDKWDMYLEKNKI